MNSQREEFIIKFQKWLKESISIIALILVSGVYVLYGLITIDATGKTIPQIIADGGVSFLVGYVIKCLLNNQGLVNGEKSEVFTNSKNFYLGLLDDVAPIQQYLPFYCDYTNEQTLKRVQSSILRAQNIKYSDFINNNLDFQKLDKRQKKAVLKARKVTIHMINDSVLLSDSQVNLDIGKELNVSKKSYTTSSNAVMLTVSLMIALLFGYFGIDKESGFDKIGAIWSAIQVAVYLALGSMQYFQGFNFMADTYRTALVRKSNHLERFKNMYNENPNRFKEEEGTKEEKKEEINVDKLTNEEYNSN